jgi:hypothetical protein
VKPPAATRKLTEFIRIQIVNTISDLTRKTADPMRAPITNPALRDARSKDSACVLPVPEKPSATSAYTTGPLALSRIPTKGIVKIKIHAEWAKAIIVYPAARKR